MDKRLGWDVALEVPMTSSTSEALFSPCYQSILITLTHSECTAGVVGSAPCSRETMQTPPLKLERILTIIYSEA